VRLLYGIKSCKKTGTKEKKKQETENTIVNKKRRKISCLVNGDGNHSTNRKIRIEKVQTTGASDLGEKKFYSSAFNKPTSNFRMGGERKTLGKRKT